MESAGQRTLNTSSLREQATQVIRAQIITGELAPGALHSVGGLASDLGVSITPVREALLDLTEQGLIEMVRNRGFRVPVLSEQDLDEIEQLRRMLEVPAVCEIAARHLVTDAGELRQLSNAIQEAAAAGDWRGTVVHDNEFHLRLLGYLDNRRLVRTVARLRDQSRLPGLNRDTRSERTLQSMREHDELLDAIATGEASRAEEVMILHLRHTRGIWANRDER